MARRNLIGALLAAACVIGAARHAAAQGMSSACGTENLLANRLPIARQDVHGDLSLATDGRVAPEGAQWDAPVGVFLDTLAATITYDLGDVHPVSAFMLQADANDTYKIFGAEVDSPSAYKLLVEVESVVNVGHGLRTRTISIPTTQVRYLRVGEALGDNAYSISEFQAYCRAPTPFPPKLPIVDAPAAKVIEQPWWKFYWFENDASARFEMVLAALGAALLGWGLWLAKKGRGEDHKWLRDRLLMALGLISFACYFNFGLFHFRNYVHQWDTFHYYVGSKYFKELSYDRLYECVAVADAEEPGLRRRVELRKVMNLRTNMMEGTQQILGHPEHCKDHFTPERWAAFKHDVGYFRSKHDVKRWEEAQTDHGYNGTPVWNIVGTTLSNTAPASDDQIAFLTKIDPLFIFGITLMTWWAFGWRTTAVALAVFATNFPSRFYWTGGAFLRWDWLFYFVGGVCLVKKDRPFLGGLFIGYSTLLRIFPLFTFFGPILVLVRQAWEAWPKEPDRPWWRQAKLPTADDLRAVWARLDRRFISILAGGAVAFAVLFPISLVTSNGLDGYRAFIFNTNKHKETPLTNYMGLRTVVIYTPAEAGRVLKNDRLEDPWGTWKKTKLARFHNPAVKGVYLLFVGGFLVLMFAALRNAEPWMACSMGAMMMAVGVELTCYYYSFLFAVTFLFKKRHEAGAILLGATALTGFIDWAPTKYLPDTGIFANLKMSQWLDEQYMWMSVATLGAFVWILYRFGYLETPAVGEPEAATASDESASKGAAGRKSSAGRRNTNRRGNRRR